MKSEKESTGSQQTEQAGLVPLLRKNFWSLLVLLAIVGACIAVVSVFKKPGQMSVIESQNMDMSSMVPPRGAVPVGIAKVAKETVSSSVTYTGTVQAYNDDDIYPRLTGRIVKMLVYPGDKVKKGQLIVQLDPSGNSEYSAEKDEARLAEASAAHDEGIAKSEMNEKRYMLAAAQEAEQSAKKAADQAQAYLTYWKPEVERQKALLKAQVVSLDEYQKELAELNSAQAKVEEAQAKVREATNSRLAAQAALDMMIHHVGHQFTLDRQAQAALKKASIQEDYTRIHAPADGVVTRRLISPGVVVSPGMLLLKIAEVKQVRIQAQVATEDADKIHLGDKVYIKGSEDTGKELTASITSMFPAADATSRTFTVESLIDNTAEAEPHARHVGDFLQYRYLPGQYVIMRIVTGEKEGLVVPTSSVIWSEGKAHVWRVGDSKQVEIIEVQVGLHNPDKTEIVKGLSEGDEVVYAGYENLEPGTPVVGTEWGGSGPLKMPTAAEVQGNRLDASNNWTHEEMAGNLMLSVSLQPPRGGANSVVVSVSKHGGGAVSGAAISGTTSMPGMDMSGPSLSGTTGGDGRAQMKCDLSGGLWRLKMRIAAAGEDPVETTLDAEVP